MGTKLYATLAAAMGLFINTGGCDDTAETEGTGGSGTGGTATGGSGGGTGGMGNNTAEYGMPYAEYVVSGHVEDGAGTPIEGIELTLGGMSEAVQSAADGTFTIETPGSFCHPDCTVDATDVDGEDNGGLFADKTVDVTLTQTDPGSGSWDEGTWEADDVAVTLELAGAGGGDSGGGGTGGT